MNLNAVYFIIANLKELKLRLRFCCSVVVAVKLWQILPDGGLAHFIQDRHREIVLHSEISLPMELQDRD